MSNCITIYTDASWCYETKAGGWGCWIKSGPGQSSTHSGQFKKLIANNNLGEFMAVANAISVAKKLYDMNQKILVVVTDSQSVIDYIELARKHKTVPNRITKKGNKSPRTRVPELFDLAKTILAMIPMGCELRVNKVKAHSSKDGKRSYVNKVVDNAAKSKMKIGRESRRK